MMVTRFRRAPRFATKVSALREISQAELYPRQRLIHVKCGLPALRRVPLIIRMKRICTCRIYFAQHSTASPVVYGGVTPDACNCRHDLVSQHACFRPNKNAECDQSQTQNQEREQTQAKDGDQDGDQDRDRDRLNDADMDRIRDMLRDGSCQETATVSPADLDAAVQCLDRDQLRDGSCTDTVKLDGTPLELLLLKCLDDTDG